ncbi:MAG TPA: hypothetical protein PLA50_01450 [Bacteroidia bacterium]|nr:hypothetical protein [Bacteroidia bacterium]
MATIKVACPKCGQKVSGDESFYGTTVECPVCTSAIRFPGEPRPAASFAPIQPVPPESSPEPAPSTPPADEAPPVSKPEPPAAPDAGSIPLPSPTAEGEAGPPSPLWGAVSIVSAVLSIVTCVGGPVFAPIAIIAGHTALAKARHSPVQPAPGHTLGALGLMIGYVSLAITILVLLALVVFQESLRPYLPWGQQ